MKHMMIVCGVALGAVTLLSSCSRLAEVRYKVSVELEENGTRKTGSSTWLRRISRPTVALASSYESEFRGEGFEIDARRPVPHHGEVEARRSLPSGKPAQHPVKPMPVAHEPNEAKLHSLVRRPCGKPGKILEIDAVRHHRDARARHARRRHMASQHLGDRQDDVRAAPDKTLRGMGQSLQP